MQQGVSIVKASAGSGKTHRLTRDYIELLLQGDEQSYKHILAVTFTNKATDEMKSRVIEKLHEISKGSGSEAEKARTRLSRLLHDYSCFSVSTIDKFFQTVMRSFAREIGQYASYRVELDTDAVLDQAVDLLLESIEDPANGNLFQWLQDYSIDLVERGDGWNIAGPLKTMAKQFLDEKFLLKIRRAGRGTGVLGDKASLKAFIQKLDTITADYEREAEAIGKEGLQLLSSYGLGPADLHQKSHGAAMVFKRLAGRESIAKLPSRAYIEGAVKSFRQDPAALRALFDRVEAHFGEPRRLYNTVSLIRKNLYLLGIYTDLQRTLDGYLRENNVVLLQLSTDLLNRIIADDDAPFVYERIGNRYEHLMLDEAQDTSLMQWNNFRPLFRNSQASGGCNLVVGDIKQSIYRWRGSDWQLLSKYLREDLVPDGLREETLTKNWRSGEAIVSFNNLIFSSVSDALAVKPENVNLASKVKEIYEDCKQEIPHEHDSDPSGYVRVEFLRKEGNSGAEWRAAALKKLISSVRSLVAEGYDYKDITVIVRKNGEGAQAASELIRAGISVLTEDSLQIGSSPCISRLMSLLGWLVDPEDPVNELQARGLKDALPELTASSLYETCEQLLGGGVISHGESDLPFIHAFLDAVLAFQEKYGSSLRAFVKWWEEVGHKKSICAPDGQNAVRVMTVHKAKGLSLDAVIIPFCSESFTPSSFHPSTIWCTCPESLAGPALIPVKASGKLSDSYFEADYEEERTFEYIDVINTWYVAFTRARSRLLVYVPSNAVDKDDEARIDLSKTVNPSGIEHVLFQILKGHGLETSIYESGCRSPFVRRQERSKLVDDPQQDFRHFVLGDERLKLSLRGEDYFAEDVSARRSGIEQHGEMARVMVSPELEARSGGRHWFDGTYRVMNEASIVDASGEIRRPDRVLVSENSERVIVIDYKFGHPRSSHRSQVRTYMELLRQMGYPSVEGWLWYVTENDVVQVG